MFWDVLNELIKVLQKNRINKNIYCVYILYIICYMKSIQNDIYYKELAHVILEAETPCDLLSAGWRPKKAHGSKSNLSLKVWKPGASVNPSPGAEDQSLSSCIQAGRMNAPSLPFPLFRSLVDWMMPTCKQGGQFVLLRLQIQILITSRNSPTDTSERMFISGNPGTQPSWHIKFTITLGLISDKPNQTLRT